MKIDQRTTEELSRHFRHRVLKETGPQNVQGCCNAAAPHAGCCSRGQLFAQGHTRADLDGDRTLVMALVKEFDINNV